MSSLFPPLSRTGHSIQGGSDLTTHFLAQFFPPRRTAKLRNDILMFQQHQGESLSKAWTRFKDLLQKVPHHGIDLWIQVQIFYDHVNPVTRRTINQSAGGKLRDQNAEESWALLEDLALYDNKNVPSTSDCHLIELENQIQRFMEAHLAPKQHVQVNKISSSCEICSGPYDTQYCMENPEQAFVDYTSSRTDEAGADGTKSYPVGIDKDVEVYIGRLKLLNDFYILDMKKDPETPLLVGRGFLATTNAVIDCRKAKIVVGEGMTRSVFGVKETDPGEEEAPYWTTLRKRESYRPRPSLDSIGAQTSYYAIKEFMDCHLPEECDIAGDAQINPFKDVIVFRRMVEFLGAFPINLKGNMSESEDLIDKPIN
ncbi:MAK10-like protein [Tanacetum coccineum]